MNNIFSSLYKNTIWIWPPIIVILLVLTAMVTLLAVTGLSQAEKQMPNAFHGKYLNYPNLWLILKIYPLFSALFIIAGGIAIMTYSNKQQSESEVDNR